jgi:hypothetical protein
LLKRAIQNAIAEATSTETLAAEAAERLKQVFKDMPKTVPKFKNAKAAQEWLSKNIINKLDNPLEEWVKLGKARTVRKWKGSRAAGTRELVQEVFDDLVGWSSYNPELMRMIAQYTLDMSRRFGMKLPNYLGLTGKHVKHRYLRGRELASVDMETDSLLLPTTITNKKKLLSRFIQGERYKSRRTLFEGPNLPLQKVEAEFVKLLRLAEQDAIDGAPFADDLVKALRIAIKEKDYAWTARMPIADHASDAVKQATQMMKTIIHETGHRLHSQFRRQIDDILKAWEDETTALMGRGRMLGIRHSWWRQTSEYPASPKGNVKEFVAEQYSRYMAGEHDRVFPPLRDFFKSIDTGDTFGGLKELLPQLFGEL